MFNPSCSAIFFETFYRSHTDSNYLLNIILSFSEPLHLSKLQVYKFVKLNPFNSITNVPFGDLRYEKLNACCSAKCDETFCNKVKLRFVDKKK